ncbi:uncharacterized protein G2W53_008677 [Senna tora]|uniref:Uncharacterized protein n=1 Tax=Senna tora TaxID=362788 RepID=A0A835CHF6_9FABA|nr:uncharacterized protein G2W53_008677 [Senna tora]
MASSSHHYSNNYQSFKDKVSSRTPKQNLDEEEEEEEGNHKEWLKLKLGVGGIGSGSSSSKIVVHEEEEEEESSKEEEARSGCSVGLGLGLGLGPKMKKEKEGVTLEWSRRLFIGKEGSWKKDYSQHWMDMGIPEQENADSHHCSTNLPHLSGLWFTLHSSTNR